VTKEHSRKRPRKWKRGRELILLSAEKNAELANEWVTRKERGEQMRIEVERAL